jgi:hypothetical protein
MSGEKINNKDSESLLNLLDKFLFRYNQGIYAPLNEDSKACVLCFDPIEPGSDAIEMVDFLKVRGIVAKFSNYFHRSCIDFYKRRKKYLDSYFFREGYSFRDNLKTFRSHFEIYRALKKNGIELLI